MSLRGEELVTEAFRIIQSIYTSPEQSLEFPAIAAESEYDSFDVQLVLQALIDRYYLERDEEAQAYVLDPDTYPMIENEELWWRLEEDFLDPEELEAEIDLFDFEEDDESPEEWNSIPAPKYSRFQSILLLVIFFALLALALRITIYTDKEPDQPELQIDHEKLSKAIDSLLNQAQLDSTKNPQKSLN